MTDKELSNILNMSVQTMSDWKKKDTDNYRKILYELIQSFTKEELEERVKAIKLLKGIK